MTFPYHEYFVTCELVPCKSIGCNLNDSSITVHSFMISVVESNIIILKAWDVFVPDSLVLVYYEGI